LVVCRPGGHKDPTYIARIIRQEKITTLHFVPSMLQIFLDNDEAAQGENLARVVCSGEALPAPLAQLFFERLPDCELHNLYGPTEAAVDVTAWDCREGTIGSAIPIGRPVANTRIYVLDLNLQPVPVGVAGEIYIAGVQVGRGYLTRAELTADRFQPDLFSPEGGARMYRTGDLGRWMPDGKIEYLGRTDFQIKVRGFRIELGEIEAELRGHSGVKDVVVVAVGEEGDKRLAAYLTGDEITADVLRAHLSTRLPEHMIPSAFVRLDTLPLSPNGKVDRRALPAPGAEAFVRRGYEAPQGQIERRLSRPARQLLRARRPFTARGDGHRSHAARGAFERRADAVHRANTGGNV
jgi:acyl-CoA synthetase (AMP-forming)/AMP-acid ligase II